MNKTHRKAEATGLIHFLKQQEVSKSGDPSKNLTDVGLLVRHFCETGETKLLDSHLNRSYSKTVSLSSLGVMQTVHVLSEVQGGKGTEKKAEQEFKTLKKLLKTNGFFFFLFCF